MSIMTVYNHGTMEGSIVDVKQNAYLFLFIGYFVLINIYVMVRHFLQVGYIWLIRTTDGG
jgi:hypothetical protein